MGVWGNRSQWTVDSKTACRKWQNIVPVRRGVKNSPVRKNRVLIKTNGKWDKRNVWGEKISTGLNHLLLD